MATNINAASSRLSDWRFQTKHVQQVLNDGLMVSAQSTVLCSGPAELADRSNSSAATSGTTLNSTQKTIPDVAFLIGVVDNVTLNQINQILRLYELGSKRCYILTGRHFANLSLARVFFHGPNLLKVLYAYYQPIFDRQGWEEILGWRSLDGTVNYPNPSFLMDANFALFAPAILEKPGLLNLFINLQSDLFQNPFGLGIVFHDSQDRKVGEVYCENCKIETHTIGVAQNTVIATEAVRIQLERVMPVTLAIKPATTT